MDMGSGGGAESSPSPSLPRVVAVAGFSADLCSVPSSVFVFVLGRLATKNDYCRCVISSRSC